MIKLVITDIDGTLTEEGSESLNPEYFDVFSQLMEKGVKIVAASGRNIVSIRKIMAPLADEIMMVSQNGSAIAKGDKIIIPNPFPKEWADGIWEELSHVEGALCVLNAGIRSYTPYDGNELYNLMKTNYGYDIHATGGWSGYPEDETYTMIALFHPDNAEAFYEEHLSDKWKKRLNCVCTGQKWVDMVMPGTSKAVSLQYIMDQFNLKAEEVMAFGDNINDISMIQLAGIGITVANARDEVKAVADKIVPSHHENGVLEELKALLKTL